MTAVTIGQATLHLGDFAGLAADLPDVDHVLADPAYEADAHGASRRLRSGTARDGRKLVDEELPFEPMTPELRALVGRETARLSRGWVLAFCQIEAVGLWRAAMEDGGASWRRALLWVKPDPSPQLSGDRPAAGCEAIAAAWAGAGRSVWNGGGRAGVLSFSKHDPGFGRTGQLNYHPTQKPLALMRELVRLFTQPGDLILDPFMGSGSTGVAAIQMGRRFIGVEKNPVYFERACQRLSTAAHQLELAL